MIARDEAADPVDQRSASRAAGAARASPVVAVRARRRRARRRRGRPCRGRCRRAESSGGRSAAGLRRERRPWRVARLPARATVAYTSSSAVGDAVEVVDALDVRARGALRSRRGAAGPSRRARASRSRSVSLVALTIGTGDAVRLLRASHGLVVQECDDGLAERHALDREQAVPAGVQLVDDDVGVAVAGERLVVAEPFDDPELDVEALARRDDVLGALPAAGRRRVDDHGAASARRRRPA